MNWNHRGLYAITPDPAPDATARDDAILCDQVAQAIAGGARLVQYRAKRLAQTRQREQAAALVRLCRAADVPLIINDNMELAAAVGAAGVHLGDGDGDPVAARALLGAEAIIGVSCYDRLDLAQAAEAAGVDYCAFGAFFPSTVKPDTVRVAPGLLTRARAGLRVPLVAIGGITPQNGELLIQAGADLLAVITGIFSAPDVAAAARAYTQLFEPGKRPTETPR